MRIKRREDKNYSRQEWILRGDMEVLDTKQHTVFLRGEVVPTECTMYQASDTTYGPIWVPDTHYELVEEEA